MSITSKSQLNGSWSQYIRPGKQILRKKIMPNSLSSKSLLYKILPTNLGACKPTFYNSYSSHLRRNSTMRRCIYHTGLGQNAVFHNSVFQDKLHSVNIQDDQSWAFSETVKKISKITYTASWFSLLASAKFAVRVVVELFEWTLTELRFNIIKNLCLFFYLMVL